MQDNSSWGILDILIGEKLSSVIFVMDYLQIDFDGNRFTFNIWPEITVDRIDYRFGDQFYRDKLCSLIAKIVSETILIENDKMEIKFDDSNKLYLSLDPTNLEITTPEIVDFVDTNGRWIVL
jgi:hypothetical protein